MTSLLTRPDGRADATDGAPGRRVERRLGLPSGRAVIGGFLMAIAAVSTFVAYAGTTDDGSVEVLVAGRDLRPGDTITADDVDLVPVELPGTIRGLFGSIDAAVGRQVVAAVGVGEFLQASATTEAVDGEEVLELTVAVPGNRAVGGLAPGQRVDVFSTWNGSVTELIAVDARVVDVSGGDAALLSGSEQIVVRLALRDFGQVEALVHAQAAGDITMIRSAIGTEVHDVGREYRPASGSTALRHQPTVEGTERER